MGGRANTAIPVWKGVKMKIPENFTRYEKTNNPVCPYCDRMNRLKNCTKSDLCLFYWYTKMRCKYCQKLFSIITQRVYLFITEELE